MQEIYENIAENINTNPQMFGFLNWLRKENNITIIGFGNGLTTLLALSKKPQSITIYDHNIYDGISDFESLANQFNVKFKFVHKMILDLEEIGNTDILVIDSFAEGNFVHTICTKFQQFVNRYIIINNTFNFAHKADPQIKLGNGGQPIGMVFGINHFLQNNDPWHIAENMYWAPGLTMLYRRKDLLDDGK